jgi:hypothetical protein
LGVGLDVSEYRDDELASVHVERSAAFEALLIDPRLFMRLRESEAEQQTIVDQLMRMGFEHRIEFFADRLVWLHRH